MNTKSLREYVHENDLFDNMLLALESAMTEVNCAMYDSKDQMRKAHQAYVFESASKEYFTEEVDNARKGFFAKIGQKVMYLIEKFRDFVEDIILKIKGIFDKNEREANNAKKVLKEHPEMAKQMMAAIECPDMSMKDVQQFNSECMALMAAYKKSKDMDEETFKSKFQSILDKFTDHEKQTKNTINTIVDALKYFAVATAAVLGAKKALSDINKVADDFKKDVERQTIYQGSKASAVFAALNQMIGVNTKALNERTTLQERIGGLISKFNASVGKKITDKAEAKKDKVKQNIDNYEAEQEKKKKDKELKDAEFEAQKKATADDAYNKRRKELDPDYKEKGKK